MLAIAFQFLEINLNKKSNIRFLSQKSLNKENNETNINKISCFVCNLHLVLNVLFRTIKIKKQRIN